MIAEPIRTARLLLRRPTAGDAAGILAAYAGDPEVTRYLSWPTHGEIGATLGFVEFSEAEWRRWPSGPLLIEDAQSGDLLGSTGLAFQTDYRAATGYVLRRDAWGRGYASEALQAMVELAQRSGLWRLEAHCHAAHGASARVLENGGFGREGLLRRQLRFPNLGTDEPQDVLLYGKILRP